MLDTAVLDSTHPDFLSSRIHSRARNIIYPTKTVADDYGRWTEVSGVIGAATNNNLGVSGVDWQAKILPIKVLDNTGSGTDDDLIAGLNYASSVCHADVINMSLGEDPQQQPASPASLPRRL